MNREEATKILEEYLALDSDVDSEYLQAQRVAIKSLKAIDEIIDCLHDSIVAWRYITDDFISDIVNKYMEGTDNGKTD